MLISNNLHHDLNIFAGAQWVNDIMIFPVARGILECLLNNFCSNFLEITYKNYVLETNVFTLVVEERVRLLVIDVNLI